MENLFITVMFLLVSFVHTSPSGNCSSPHSSLQCNTSLLMVNNYEDCSISNKIASVKCKGGSTIFNFTCINNQSHRAWDPPLSGLCSQVTSTSTSTSTKVPSKTTARTSSESSETTIIAANVSSEETVRSGSTEMSTPPTTAGTLTPTGTNETTRSAFTQTQMTEKTNSIDNTFLSTRKSPAKLDDSGSVVVPVVSVFVVVVIALAAVIIFLLWRHRRMKQQKAKVDYAGRSISNRGYEDGHGLDRHISLLDMRYDDSNDSGYAEISPGKLNVEESPDNEYQTIEDLPEDKMDGNSGYGHLKMQTTTFIDNNYSHVAVNQNGKQSSDVTYSHTGNPLNGQEFKDDEETTYNHLEQNARNIQETQQPLKNEEKEVVGDVDAEYNHAKAGHLAVEPDNKGDTYSHLNNTRNSRRIQQDDLKFLTHGSKTETYKTKTGNFDSDKGDGKNTFPEYAKCAKTVNDRETPKQVGRDGYETPAGAANIYFTLEPESKPADRDVSFQVTNETFEDSEGEESPNHQYFILEKTDTNT